MNDRRLKRNGQGCEDARLGSSKTDAIMSAIRKHLLCHPCHTLVLFTFHGKEDETFPDDDTMGWSDTINLHEGNVLEYMLGQVNVAMCK